MFFQCPACQVKLKATPAQIGQQFRCPKCRTVGTVPMEIAPGSNPSAALSFDPVSGVGSSRDIPGVSAPSGPPSAMGSATAVREAVRETPAPAPWTPGMVLLDDFVVERHVAAGGMGDVYLLRSRSASEPFAAKRIHPRLLGNWQYRKAFLKELRTWVDLADHPNLTACRFFRTLDDQVIIFAEFVPGGSLDLWIREGRVGTIQRVLDVAIQAAWGLEAAHHQGVIHQDMKPANVLMMEDPFLDDSQQAKVTDFGLAQAKAAAAPNTDGATSGQRKSGVGTQAYCSPEQKAGELISAQTDAWGWGVTILEMLLGKRTWLWGTTAGSVLDELVEQMERGKPAFRVQPPRSLIDVMRRCFRRNPVERFRSMREAADALIAIYEIETGQTYPRTCPAFSSRHRAPSHPRRNKHGDCWSDPAEWVAEARRLLNDGADLNAWLMEPMPGSVRAHAIDDLIPYEAIDNVFTRLIGEGRQDLNPTLARLSYEKGLVHQAAGDLSGAVMLFDRALKLLAPSAESLEENVRKSLSRCNASKGWTLNQLGNHLAAIEAFDLAIAAQLGPNDKASTVAEPGALADCYLGKAVACAKSGTPDAAVRWFDAAIAVLEKLAQQRQAKHLDDLAGAYRDKALALSLHAKSSPRDAREYLELASALLDRAAELYDRPGNEEELRERSVERAKCFLNKGSLLFRLGEPREALKALNYAIAFLESLDRQQVQREWAVCQMNRAVILDEVEGEAAAIEGYETATEALEQLVRQAARPEFTRDLAIGTMNRGCALLAMGDELQAGVLLGRAMKLLAPEAQKASSQSAREDLAVCAMNRAVLTGRRGHISEAAATYRQVEQLLETLIQEGYAAAADHLGLCLMNLGTLDARSGKRGDARSLYNQAISAIGSGSRRRGRFDLAADLAVCYLNKALTWHTGGIGWFAAWMVRRAAGILRSWETDDGPASFGDAPLRMLATLMDKHDGRPSLSAITQFLRTQSLVASRGTINRTRKRLIDLL